MGAVGRDLRGAERDGVREQAGSDGLARRPQADRDEDGVAGRELTLDAYVPPVGAVRSPSLGAPGPEGSVGPAATSSAVMPQCCS